MEPDETKAEPLTSMTEQPEVITPQPTANQAMKGAVKLIFCTFYWYIAFNNSDMHHDL